MPDSRASDSRVRFGVSHHINIRTGFSFLNASKNFNYDSLHLKGQIGLKTLATQLDWFPRAGGFHISHGLLMFMGNPLNATAGTTPGQSFSLGGNDYSSGSTNPVSGNVKINSRKAAPMFTVGWGNLVSRKEGKHFTVPFEVGLAITGAPKATYQLSGNVCTDSFDPATSVTVQTLSSYLKVYPIVKIGIGYKF